jgi:hypothetical protein
MKNLKQVAPQSWPTIQHQSTIWNDRGEISRYSCVVEQTFHNIHRLLRNKKILDIVKYKDLYDHLDSVCSDINASEIFHRQSEQEGKP